MQADLESSQSAQRDTDVTLRETQQQLESESQQRQQLAELLAAEQSARTCEQTEALQRQQQSEEEAQRVEMDLRQEVSEFSAPSESC